MVNKLTLSTAITAFLMLCPVVAGAATATPLAREMPDSQNNKVVELFQEQARLVEGYVGGQMQVVLLHTNDPLVREFVARGITKTTPEAFSKTENGLAAVMVDGGKINGVKTLACYIVYNKERAGHIWRNFLVPMGKGEDLSTGAAFLVGHEVAHCLDHLERKAMLGSQSSWPVEKAAVFGVLPDAWRMVGGGETINLTDYSQKASQVYSQRGQMQYTERVADIFGALWAFHQGAAPEIADTLRTSRNALDWSSHATVPALAEIEKHATGAKALTPAEMWALARGLQVQAGVDKSVAMNGEKAGTAVASVPKPDPQTVATAQQAKDLGVPTPGSVQAPAVAPARPIPVNFNDLPKFGRRGFSQN